MNRNATVRLLAAVAPMKTCLLWLGSWLPLIAQPQLVASLQSNGYVLEIRAVAASDFQLPKLRARAEQFASKHKSVSFGILTVGTGPEVGYYGSKGGTTDGGLDNYFYRLQHVYPDGPDAWKNLAVALKIGQSVVLRFKHNGTISTTTLRSSGNGVSHAAQDYEVLHIAPIFIGPREVGGVELFVRYRVPMKQKEVDELAKNFAQLYPSFMVRVFARPDAWFPYNGFPFIYVFDDPVRIPTRGAYDDSATLMGVWPPWP